MGNSDQVVERARRVAARCAAIASDLPIYPVAEFDWLAEAGLLTAPLTPDCGGLGLGVVSGTTRPLLDLLAIVGSGDLSVGRIYEGHVNALQLIQLFGDDRLRDQAARAAQAGAVFGVWNIEGSDGVHLSPTIGGYRLHGSKTFASGAGGIAQAIVTGRLPNGGWQMCLIDLTSVPVAIDPTWWQPIGMAASVSGKVDFSGIEVAGEDLIGPPDAYHRQPWFAGGAVRFAAVQLGGARSLFAAMRDYLRAADLTTDPYVQARAGEATVLLESGGLWLRGAADRLDNSAFYGLADDSDGVVTYANAMRTAIERICRDVMTIAERSVGARGLLRPHPVERLLRDLTIYLRQPAPDAALAQVGRAALDTDPPW